MEKSNFDALLTAHQNVKSVGKLSLNDDVDVTYLQKRCSMTIKLARTKCEKKLESMRFPASLATE